MVKYTGFFKDPHVAERATAPILADKENGPERPINKSKAFVRVVGVLNDICSTTRSLIHDINALPKDYPAEPEYVDIINQAFSYTRDIKLTLNSDEKKLMIQLYDKLDPVMKTLQERRDGLSAESLRIDQINEQTTVLNNLKSKLSGILHKLMPLNGAYEPPKVPGISEEENSTGASGPKG